MGIIRPGGVFLIVALTDGIVLQDEGSLVQRQASRKHENGFDVLLDSIRRDTGMYMKHKTQILSGQIQSIIHKQMTWTPFKGINTSSLPQMSIAHTAMLLEMGKHLDETVENVRRRAEEENAKAKDETANLMEARWEGKKCGLWCSKSIAIDVLLLVLGSFGVHCGPASVMFYYLFGMAVLVGDEQLSIEDAILVLGQMSTTVGYGTVSPRCAKKYFKEPNISLMNETFRGTGGTGNALLFKELKKLMNKTENADPIWPKKTINNTREFTKEYVADSPDFEQLVQVVEYVKYYLIAQKEKDQDCDGLMLFHSFHSWVGVILVNSQWDAATQMWLLEVVKAAAEHWKVPLAFVDTIFLVLELFISTAVYRVDFIDHCNQGYKVNGKYPEPWCKTSQWMNALYMNIVTFSSMGYGDFSPNTNWGKALSPIMMQVGTNFFNDMAAMVGGDPPTSVRPDKAFHEMVPGVLAETYSYEFLEQTLEWQGAASAETAEIKSF
eukprot:CAMPEP_0197920342 /NCGR_PEP_ID=MMETSP1439-20131203/88792_1 /TAXON_ID=66791 /ORGANISM="Gonyaulax spinifera, Strain CCMP409" /LENGTH=494 /DNA_ID=CAMNT_0043542541 /DNA_START=196 /DNA_END=1679 /DNA_ORIENTATION=-